MRINEIEITNFKSFEKKRLPFNSSFSLIIGDNGTGKTSVLEALSIGLGGYLAGIDGITNRNIQMDEVRTASIKQGDATVTTEPQFPCSIRCEGIIHDRHFTWERSVHKKEGRTNRTKAKDVIQHATQVQQEITQSQNQDIILPIISYQSAGRLFSQKKEKWINPFEKQNLSRFTGYMDCLEAESNIKLFINWLRRMTLIELQKNIKIGELSATKTAIETFMQGLGEEGDRVTVTYDFELEEVIVLVGEQQMPLRLMSSGYRSVIGMVADLAFRMALLNPQLRENAVQETPGVVLIDELDLHLHPKWQWNIVEDLKRTFPKIQFIATTHAPIIIASCKEGEIIRLAEEATEDIIVHPSAYGWQVEDILDQVMDSQNRAPSVERKIKEVEKLYAKKMEQRLNKEDQQKLRKLEKELKLLLPEEDPAVTLAKLNAIENKLINGVYDEKD